MGHSWLKMQANLRTLDEVYREAQWTCEELERLIDHIAEVLGLPTLRPDADGLCATPNYERV